MEALVLADEETKLATKIHDCLLALSQIDPMAHPDMVADSIESGESFLYLHDDGFSVLTPHFDKLHVWVSCAYTGRANLPNAVTDFIQVAKLLELPKITFGSLRNGWHRVAPKLGFHFDGEFYTRIVDVNSR